MKNDSFLLIINPISGKKNGKSKIDFLINYFKNYNIIPKIFLTEYKGHAHKYLQKIDNNLFTNIIVYGGDGTFNEVINGILSRDDQYMPTLGFLPGGSGNSVMHHFNKLNLKKACNLIIDNRIKKIDVMEIVYPNNIEYSINILGWGMVTDIGNLAEKMRWLGPIRYNVASLFYILNTNKRYANISIDGVNSSGHYLFILIANTKYTGKGMMIAPNAQLDDGLLDLIIVKNNINKIQLIKLLSQLYTGEHIYSKYVDYRQIKNLNIIPSKNDYLNIDGEIYGTTPVTISILSKKLSIYSH